MRTRTLLILAVCCGFAILLAGGIQLLRIANQESADAEYHDVGEQVDIGDLAVVVESFTEVGGVATVEIRIGGTVDDDATADFRLVVPGEAIEPSRRGERACGAATVDEQSCELSFGVAGAAGGNRILLFERGDEVARWELAA